VNTEELITASSITLEHQEPIYVVCSSNDLFALMLFTFLVSLGKNHKTGEPLICLIISQGISAENKERIAYAINQEIIELQWVEIDLESYKNIHPQAEEAELTANYARLLIPDLLPDQVKKVIYMDIDTLVLGEISELWNLSLEGYALGAVHDWNGVVNDALLIPNYEELGFSDGGKYFNSGVLLIDLERWREEKIAYQLIQCTIVNKDYVQYDDQYAFNVVFHKQWKELPKSWNFLQVYPPEPKINLIHYLGRQKPTLKMSKGYYHHFFYRYLDEGTAGTYTIYKQLHQVSAIEHPHQLPELLEALELRYHPDVFKTINQGIVIEPDGGILSEILLKSDPELFLVRLGLLEDGNISDFNHIASTLEPYWDRIMLIEKHINDLGNAVAAKSYSFLYLDREESLSDSLLQLGGIMHFLHLGGLFCGICTQAESPKSSDFKVLEKYDMYFKVEDCTIQWYPLKESARWFWYLVIA